jgi:hypothetical protein
VKDLVLKTVDDVSSWTADDWVPTGGGVASLRDVRDVEIVDCVIENVLHGSGDRIRIPPRSISKGNTIKNYSVDGARIIGDNVYFAYNAITDCYDVDDNHDDAIQSYSRGADGSVGDRVIKNVDPTGHLIVASTDPNNELAGIRRASGAIDGFFENWVVENNVVVTSHYHGISYYGMTDSVIPQQHRRRPDGDDDPVPWILVTAHKNGTESRAAWWPTT